MSKILTSAITFTLLAAASFQVNAAGPQPDRMIVCESDPHFQIAVWDLWKGGTHLHGNGSRSYYYYPNWTPSGHGGWPDNLTPLEFAKSCKQRALRGELAPALGLGGADVNEAVEGVAIQDRKR